MIVVKKDIRQYFDLVGQDDEDWKIVLYYIQEPEYDSFFRFKYLMFIEPEKVKINKNWKARQWFYSPEKFDYLSDHPCHLLVYRDKTYIIDGHNRLVKALQEGKEEALVKILRF